MVNCRFHKVFTTSIKTVPSIDQKLCGKWIAAVDAGGAFYETWTCVVDDFGNLVPVK